jgi:hypothetical protein
VAFGEVYKNYTLFYIDDGSGENIAVKIQRLPAEDVTPESPSNTTVSNVSISTTIGASDIRVDGIQLDIGTVVKLKCTIERFRDKKQLVLQRAALVQSTSEEAMEWEQQANWIVRLSQPWTLKTEELAELDRKHKEDKLHEEEKARKKEDYQRNKAALGVRKNEKHEAKRKQLENAMNEGALI